MTGVAFVMAWRETRTAWRHFVYFVLCIAIGVGTVVGIGLFALHVEQAVVREARGLLGGDLEVRASRPLGASGQSTLQSVVERGARLTHASELVAMASIAGSKPGTTRTQLVELKAVDAAYPLYGDVRTEPDVPLDRLLGRVESGCGVSDQNGAGGPGCFGAVVQESLTIGMHVAVGERLKIGQAIFVISGILRKEPDRMANMFSLGPRVLVSQAGLAAADLIKPGSRVRERYLIQVPDSMTMTPLLHELQGRLAKEGARVSSYRDAQPQLKQFLDQLSRYLGLIGLTALFVGGIGVATSVHAFLREKLQSIAILKTVGAESRTIVHIYLIQSLGLGLLGSGFGIALGLGLQLVLPWAVGGWLDAALLDQINFSTGLSWRSLMPIGKGVALGLLSTVLFTLWPLLRIRRVKPASIFRRERLWAEEDLGTGSRPFWARFWSRCRTVDRATLLSTVTIVSGLTVLSVWQAGSWKSGCLFIGALAAAVTILLGAASLLVKTIEMLPLPRAVGLRHAMKNLGRPGSQTAGIMTAIGLGVMVIVTIGLLERSLVRQIGENRPSTAPTFFFIDLQPDQTVPFTKLMTSRPGGLSPELTPLVRSRLQAVNGQPIRVDDDGEKEEDRRQGDDKEEKKKTWYQTREYVLTFTDRLPKDNRLVKGSWWTEGQAGAKPLVSVEEEAAKYLGLDIGSTVELDIQGTALTAAVSSIRKVDWGNFSTNFYMILSPGALAGAPMTYVATVHVAPEEEVPLQQAVVAAFPNVTVLNIGEVLEGFARVLDRLSLAIRAVASFCLLSGSLVMAAALAATRYRRLYESVILKALGATRGLIARSFAAEYALLGAVAGTVGVLLASLLSWGVLELLFDIRWSLQPAVLLLGLAATVLLTLFVGLLSTYRMLGQRPLAILRYE